MPENFSFTSSASAIPTVDPEADDFQEVRTRLITGSAGTGKTYTIRKEMEDDPKKQGILASTTGISAVNLGTTTINALLKYFNTDSLRQAFIKGRLTRRFAELALFCKELYIDEFSMLDGDQLDIFHQALREANNQQKVKKKNPDGMGLTLVGDLAQLPPVKCKWPFEAECWGMFEANHTKLEKNWRQGDGCFLDAINAIRSGDGSNGARLLKEAGVEFSNANLIDFPGTTILAKNNDVDRFNYVALSKVAGDMIRVPSERWLCNAAKAPGEWKNIPDLLQVKLGAYVMILANTMDFSYANGDCGFIKGYDPSTHIFQVELVRNQRIVNVPMVTRELFADYDPLNFINPNEATTESVAKGEPRPWNIPFYDEDKDRYVTGAIRFAPIRLAYSSTVHKTQSLTLDRVQMDVRNGFFGSPAMLYVAVSRCRTPQGLRIVGTPELVASRCKVDPKVLRWL